MTTALNASFTETTRVLRLIRLAVWRNSVTWWSFRTFVITLVIGQAVTPVLGLLVWSAAIPNSSEVATYYVALLAVQVMTVSYEHHTFANAIYKGELPTELMKPQPVVVDYLGANLAIRLWHILFGLPIILLVGHFASASMGGRDLLLAIPAVVLAGAIRFAFTYTLAMSAIWTQRAHGAVGMGETLIFLLGGIAAPLSLLPHPFQDVGRLLPFWSMLGAPAEIAAGNITGSEVVDVLVTQTTWLVILSAAAALVWRLGVRRFTSFGG